MRDIQTTNHLLKIFILFCIFVQSTSLTSHLNNDSSACASIDLKSGKSIKLIENQPLSREEFESIRDGKLEGSLFKIEGKGYAWCSLEICGFYDGWTNRGSELEKYSEGTCEKYFSLANIANLKEAPYFYDENYVVSSMTCACKDEVNPYCGNQTKIWCSDLDTQWRGKECAVLYQELSCHTCFFNSFILEIDSEFLSLNTFQIKSIIVRPGCTVFKKTNGAIYLERPYTVTLNKTKDVVGPFYHKDSENFTCTCEDDVLIEMRSASPTTTLALNTSVNSEEVNGTVSSKASPIPSEGTEIKGSHVESSEILQYAIPISAIVVVLIVGICTWRNLSKTSKWFKVLGCSVTADEKESYQMKDLNTEGPTIHQNSKTLESVLSHLNSDDWKEVLKRLAQLAKQQEIQFCCKEEEEQASSEENAILAKFSQICLPEFQIPRESFHFEREDRLGSGKFGEVFKGTLNRNAEPENVAVKYLNVGVVKGEDSLVESFLNEIRYYQIVGNGNENLLQFIGACYCNDELHILTKLCERGSLKDYLREVFRNQLPSGKSGNSNGIRKGGYIVSVKLEEDDPAKLEVRHLKQLFEWGEQIANGMEYLHSKEIIHGDLAARNVLLSHDLTAMICDFGLSMQCVETKYYAKLMHSNAVRHFPFNSLAPELLTCFSSNSNKDFMRMPKFIDIWAYGCTIWEITTLGESPYTQINEGSNIPRLPQIAEILIMQERMRQPTTFMPPKVHMKLLECWDQVPQHRPSFSELRSFFNTLQKESIG